MSWSLKALSFYLSGSVTFSARPRVWAAVAVRVTKWEQLLECQGLLVEFGEVCGEWDDQGAVADAAGAGVVIVAIPIQVRSKTRVASECWGRNKL